MRTFAWILAVLVAAVTVGVSRSAAGSQSSTASGSFTVLSEDYPFVGAVGANSFFTGRLTLVYTGGLAGPASDGDVFVVHGDGTFEGRGIEVCTGCTIGGRTGDFAAEFTVRGGPEFTEFSGHLRLICGSGELAGLRGGGAFRGSAAGNTYSYRYRFARADDGRCSSKSLEGLLDGSLEA